MSSKEYKKNDIYIFLVILTIASAIGFQGWRTLINNFAVTNVGVGSVWIGIMQSVREIPGFLSLLVVYLILIWREERIISHFTLLMGAGVMFTGMFPSHAGLIVTTLIMSTGFHYFETTRKSLILQYFDKENTPLVLGALNSTSAVMNIFIGIFIFVVSHYLFMKGLFLSIGLMVIVLAIISYFKRLPVSGGVPQHKKMILRKKYWLFYMLNFLSGARRQIFVVFAVFLLVKHYGFSVQLITILFVINNVINYFMAPIIAKKINQFGERKVLFVEYTVLFFVFLAYAFIDNAWVAGGLYVVDNIFFNGSIGIQAYFSKTADKADIAPSMAVGFTINHITAVFIPLIGGMLWLFSDKIPFIGGALIALISLYFVSFMKSEVIALEKKSA